MSETLPDGSVRDRHVTFTALGDGVFHNVVVTSKDGVAVLTDSDLREYKLACMNARNVLQEQIDDAAEEGRRRLEMRNAEMRAELAALRGDTHRASTA